MLIHCTPCLYYVLGTKSRKLLNKQGIALQSLSDREARIKLLTHARKISTQSRVKLTQNMNLAKLPTYFQSNKAYIPKATEITARIFS